MGGFATQGKGAAQSVVQHPEQICFDQRRVAVKLPHFLQPERKGIKMIPEIEQEQPGPLQQRAQKGDHVAQQRSGDIGNARKDQPLTGIYRDLAVFADNLKGLGHAQ